jgi:hypothetical protein
VPTAAERWARTSASKPEWLTRCACAPAAGCRWPLAGTSLLARFPFLTCLDLGWLERHPCGQALLERLLLQAAELPALRQLVLAEVGTSCRRSARLRTDRKPQHRTSSSPADKPAA